MMAEHTDLLRTVQAVLDRTATKALCQTCWQVVPMEGSHECDPLARAMAIQQVTGLTFSDEHKRAKGYGVQ